MVAERSRALALVDRSEWTIPSSNPGEGKYMRMQAQITENYSKDECPQQVREDRGVEAVHGSCPQRPTRNVNL